MDFKFVFMGYNNCIEPNKERQKEIIERALKPGARIDIAVRGCTRIPNVTLDKFEELYKQLTNKAVLGIVYKEGKAKYLLEPLDGNKSTIRYSEFNKFKIKSK